MQNDMCMMLMHMMHMIMIISQAFKEPDSSSKDGNLQQQENNRIQGKYENNREILTTLFIHKGKKVNTTKSTEYSR